MKPLITILFICCYFSAIANPTYNKLCEVNKCWTEQKDVARQSLPIVNGLTETEWIQVHLSLVERTLRARSTNHLSAAQKEKRIQALNYLRDYWQAGAFPQNEDYSYRTPIFIDKYDNFCAVGYLVKATGHGHISREIAAKTNLAYVREMNYPQLAKWAKDYGFTTDELAWIQPTYFPQNTTSAIGKGTSGSVYELYVDTAAQKLYVGGNFGTVDSTITANNIAYVTETGGVYTWHALGSGVNGTIHSIMKYGSNVFAGGQFKTAGGISASNIAYWDGTSWNAAGCLSGTVKELEVFDGNLYAAGSFTLCNNTSAANFAKWTGSAWQAIPGITGTINTIEVLDTMLLLGGNFTFGSGGTNVAKWNPTIGFTAYGNNITNEVNDFQIFYDSLYAACSAPNDSSILFKLRGNQWVTGPSWYASNVVRSVKTLCVLEDTCLYGGDFHYYPIAMGEYVRNTNVIHSPYATYGTSRNYFMTDSTINKMVVFKNSIIAGGMFYKSICRRVSNIRPGPAVSVRVLGGITACKGVTNGEVNANATGGYAPYKYEWSTGDTVTTLQNLPPGTYTVISTDRKGFKDTATITLQPDFIDTSVNVTGHTLVSNEIKPDSFQWVDCGQNYAAIPGATSPVFVAPKTGSYAVIIIRTGFNACIDTSRCYFVTPTNVSNISKGYPVTVYPNPTRDLTEINLPQQEDEVHISINDMTGRMITVNKWSKAQRIPVNTEGIPSGLYTLKIETGDGETAFIKLVKE